MIYISKYIMDDNNAPNPNPQPNGVWYGIFRVDPATINIQRPRTPAPPANRVFIPPVAVAVPSTFRKSEN